MLQDPSNLDVAFEYAALSSQVGDYEAAVSTLERMLIFAPNTPRLQLELGILYYRLGSYEVSRSYFAQVVANPNVPPEIAAKVRLYLQQLAIEAPWTLQVGAGGTNRRYDDPDPTISATQSETDRTFWGRAALIVPVNNTLAMVPQIEIRDQDSNYEISRFDDFSALVGLQKRF